MSMWTRTWVTAIYIRLTKNRRSPISPLWLSLDWSGSRCCQRGRRCLRLTMPVCHAQRTAPWECTKGQDTMTRGYTARRCTAWCVTMHRFVQCVPNGWMRFLICIQSDCRRPTFRCRELVGTWCWGNSFPAWRRCGEWHHCLFYYIIFNWK